MVHTRSRDQMTTSDWLQYPELNCTVATVTETAETCVPTFTRVNSVQIARYVSCIYYREIRNE